MTERSYADLADSATAFDPETKFDADIERELRARRERETAEKKTD